MNHSHSSDPITQVSRVVGVLFRPFYEIVYGVKAKTLPWEWCTLLSAFISLLLLFGVDQVLARSIGMTALYPFHPIAFGIYLALTASSGFLIWGLLQAVLRNKLVRRLEAVLLNSGLKNRIGRIPHFIGDRPVDEFTRCLTLTNANLPVADFKKARPYLESGLQVYVDEIKESRERGIVAISYSHFKLTSDFKLSEVSSVGMEQFIVGTTRTSMLKHSFEHAPHLLIAGETGGGKSTFLRQLITTLYINNQNYHFELMDLKGGLEFQLFENLPRVKVVPSVSESVQALKRATEKMRARMEWLRDNKCKDVEQFLSLPEEKRKYPKGTTKTDFVHRLIIVIDECFLLFMAGQRNSSQEAQSARTLSNEIAAQGRAMGVHLVLATQRPDRFAVDPLTKQNLNGKLCFQMNNHASSRTILDSGRAADLPEVPGRAIWKLGSKMIEVQTPNLGVSEVEALLSPYRLDQKPTSSTQSPQKPDAFEPIADLDLEASF